MKKVNLYDELSVVNETSRRLKVKLEEEGRDTFTMAELRKIKKEIYEGQ